jgi:hypothetical protein
MALLNFSWRISSVIPVTHPANKIRWWAHYYYRLHRHNYQPLSIHLMSFDLKMCFVIISMKYCVPEPPFGAPGFCSSLVI